MPLQHIATQTGAQTGTKCGAYSTWSMVQNCWDWDIHVPKAHLLSGHRPLATWLGGNNIHGISSHHHWICQWFMVTSLFLREFWDLLTEIYVNDCQCIRITVSICFPCFSYFSESDALMVCFGAVSPWGLLNAAMASAAADVALCNAVCTTCEAGQAHGSTGHGAQEKVRSRYQVLTGTYYYILPISI